MAIGDKERIESLLKVAEFNISRFDERRNHSWKISARLLGGHSR